MESGLEGISCLWKSLYKSGQKLSVNLGDYVNDAGPILLSTVQTKLIENVEGRDVRPRRGHRRGLVVEIAPNVVDATAVDMSSSPHKSVVDALELDLPVDDEFVFDPVESDEEEDHDEEATLLDALEQDLVGSPEVPAAQVDPTALGFTPENGSGSRSRSPTILGAMIDPESASAPQDAQLPSDGEDELPVWQSDLFTKVWSKRISKFEQRTDSKHWCPRRFAMSSPGSSVSQIGRIMNPSCWRRSTSRWLTVTPNQWRPRHRTMGVSCGSCEWNPTGGGEVSAQESESEAGVSI